MPEIYVIRTFYVSSKIKKKKKKKLLWATKFTEESKWSCQPWKCYFEKLKLQVRLNGPISIQHYFSSLLLTPSHSQGAHTLALFSSNTGLSALGEGLGLLPPSMWDSVPQLFTISVSVPTASHHIRDFLVTSHSLRTKRTLSIRTPKSFPLNPYFKKTRTFPQVSTVLNCQKYSRSLNFEKGHNSLCLSM